MYRFHLPTWKLGRMKVLTNQKLCQHILKVSTSACCHTVVACYWGPASVGGRGEVCSMYVSHLNFKAYHVTISNVQCKWGHWDSIQGLLGQMFQYFYCRTHTNLSVAVELLRISSISTQEVLLFIVISFPVCCWLLIWAQPILGDMKLTVFSSSVSSSQTWHDHRLVFIFFYRVAHNLLEDFVAIYLDGKSPYLEATVDRTFLPFEVNDF